MGATGTTRPRVHAEVPGGGDVRRAWWLTALVLGAVIAVFAALRWPGLLPLGSDNDEYLLVAEAASRFEAPVVAGVEGTKYPLGYPAVLAVLSWLRLPVAPAALALNVIALAAAVGLVAWVAGRGTTRWPASPGAGLAAGGLVATSAAVWNDVFSVMPEILLVAVVAGMLAVLAGPLTSRRLVALSVLAAVAVALKTLALPLVLGGAGAMWLWSYAASRAEHGRDAAGPGAGSVAAPDDGTSPSRLGLLSPAVAAVVVAGVGHLLMRPYPPHTTGYLATFPLVDPDDASQGRLGLLGMISRTFTDAPEAVRDLGRAVAFIDAGTWLAVLVAVVAFGIAVVGALRLRLGGALGPFVAGAIVAYMVAMAAWPYNSSRFGLPLVPIAALGAGWLVRVVGSRVRHRERVGEVALAVLLIGGLSLWSVPAVLERAEASHETLARQHAALDGLEEWSAQVDSGDDVTLVSFDYREAARRLDRPVQPIGYTSDPTALADQVGDADYLLVMDFYGKRNAQARTLLGAYPERFVEEFSAEGVTVYAVRP